MEDSFLWTAGIKHLEMRLIVEGAIALYEDEAVPLLGLAIKNEKYEAADALLGCSLVVTILYHDPLYKNLHF